MLSYLKIVGINKTRCKVVRRDGSGYEGDEMKSNASPSRALRCISLRWGHVELGF